MTISVCSLYVSVQKLEKAAAGPSVTEFVEVLQKFKVIFTIMVRLQFALIVNKFEWKSIIQQTCLAIKTNKLLLFCFQGANEASHGTSGS